MNTVALIYLSLVKCVLFGYVTAMGKYRNLSYKFSLLFNIQVA